MTTKLFAGLALALSLLAPAFSAPAKFEAGALQVEQVSAKGPALILIPGLASGPWAWADTTERLRGKYSIYLLTLPGFEQPVPGATLIPGGRPRRLSRATRFANRCSSAQFGGTLSVLCHGAFHLIAGVIAVDGLPVFPGDRRHDGRSKRTGAAIRAQFEARQRSSSRRPLAYMKQIGSVDEGIAMKPLILEPQRHRRHRDLPRRMTPTCGRAGEHQGTVEISPFNAPDFAAMGVDENRKTGYYRMLLAGIENLEVVSIAAARHFVMFDQPEKFAVALDGALASMVESAAR
jgi:pimeloyl-ACP methyl ester carboxylesterase